MRGLIMAMALLVAGMAEAEAYALVGSGLVSCGTWTADRRAYERPGPATHSSQSELQDAAWVVGFLSGIGFMGELSNNGADPLDNVDAEGVWAWIDNYCQAHPIDNIATAAEAFYFTHPHK